MRLAFNLLLLFTIPIAASAQLYFGVGAQIQLAGNSQFTLNNIDLVNNGSFLAGNGTVYFSGSDTNHIGGGQPVQFYNIRIDKQNGYLLLYQHQAVSNEVQFSQGYLDLNSYDLNLGNTGMLIDESETSRIHGPAGGEVLVNTMLNAPSYDNPGNLGALISSTKNLGNMVIKRGHKPQTLSSGESILRYYDISPSNNNALAATLRFHYFDAERNGIPDSALGQWRSQDGTTWTYQGFSSRDATQNYVEKTGIDAFSTWTLSTQSASLPVIFAGFNLQCDGGRVILQWKTSQEFNSSHFVIERNTGAGWTALGDLPAAGNSSIEKKYSFTDNNPVTGSYYRIAQYDIDGDMKYTAIIIANCATMDLLQAWPNPFHHAFTLRMFSNTSRSGTLRLVDARGVQVINRKLNLQRGLNQFEVDLQQVAAGVYLLVIEWADGSQAKTIRLIKQ